MSLEESLLRIWPVYIRILNFSIILCLIFFCQRNALADEALLRIHFIDVGYGDAILMEFPDSTNLLMDAGDRAHARGLVDYLKANHILKIDTAIITHPHKNHFEGFGLLMDEISIGRLFENGDKNSEDGYTAIIERFIKKNIPVKILRRGDKIKNLPAPLRMEILNSLREGDPNDNSLVVWLVYKDISILFMGDVGSQRQEILLNDFPQILSADCIKLPHHGGALNAGFIKAFAGRKLIVSTGPNPWGLPLEDQLKELGQGVAYRTDRQGTIIIETDGHTMRVVP